MPRSPKLVALFLVALTTTLMAAAPLAAAEDEGGEVLVAIYHCAPGKHLDFLRWMAAREAISKELDLPPSHWYAHLDGASWDYVVISPDTTNEQDAKIEAATKAKGLKVGFAASLEFRQFMADHTDTEALGPTTAAALIAAAGGQ